MRRVCSAGDIHFIETHLLFLADALEHALRARPLNVDSNSGMLGLERLAEVFRDRNLHGCVEFDHALLLGGVDQRRADHRRLRRGGLERLCKDGAGRQHCRCSEYVASGKLPI